MANKEWLTERFSKEFKYRAGYDEERAGWLCKVEDRWCPDEELVVLWQLYVKMVRQVELDAALLRNNASYRGARRLEMMVKNALTWRTFQAVLAEAQRSLVVKAVEG